MDKELLLDKLSTLGKDYELSGHKEVLVYCPHCDHHKPKCSINPEKEVYKCFVCNESGTLSNLLENNFQPPIELLNRNHKAVRNYLELSRGIENFPEFDVGWNDYRQSIVFPLRDANRGKIRALKHRSLNSGAKNKYWIESGGKNPGYYIPDVPGFKEASSLIIVEGEIDALSCLSYLYANNNEEKGKQGISAVSTTGINNRNIVKTLDEETVKKIYLIFDNESKKDIIKNVEEAARSLCLEIRAQLPEAEIYRVKLPIGCKDVNDFLQLGYTEQDFQALLNGAPEWLEGQVNRKAIVYFDEMVEYLNDDEKSSGLPTFIEGLDKILGGGKRMSEITVLHATAKTGKNTLYHKMMHNWLESGTAIGYCSRELSPGTEVLPNLLSIHFQQNFWKQKDNEELMKEAQKKLQEWRLFFAEGYGVMEFDQIVKWVQELKRHGVKYYFIDHLHYLLYNSEDVKEISVFCRSLKQLAKEENIHIDLIVQPRKLMEGQRLTLDSLRGGAAIGQALDNLLTLERVPEMENVTQLKLEVGRHKLTRPGKKVYLQYDPETTDIDEVSIEEEEKEIKDKLPKNIEFQKIE